MSEVTPASDIQQRLLTFEVADSIYAIPIAYIVEVGEVETLACIPTLPAETAGVMNYHGDALPVLRPDVLLAVDASRIDEPANVLVIAARPTGGARMGLPVDRVLGLVDGEGVMSRDQDPVAERRSLDDRVVFVLDPVRLVARAKEVIESSLGRSE
jgi:chemotaxis signal transduction protein